MQEFLERGITFTGLFQLLLNEKALRREPVTPSQRRAGETV